MSNQASSAASDRNLLTSDITTNNVTSTKHGFAPKSSANAAQFLNGAATPAFAAVTDANLSVSDITTNDVSTSAHGFAPKTWASAWASWTPAWTNVTIGNATVSGKYVQIGKTIIARLSVIWGNTTSASGSIVFSLPVTSATYGGTANVGYIGYGTAYDVSAGVVYDTDITLPSTTTAGVIAKAANGTWVTNATVSNTSPATWANTDEWNWNLVYEAA